MTNISKAEYFAAHAPTEIPSWFEPVTREKPQPHGYLFNNFNRTELEKQYMNAYNDEADEWYDPENKVPEDFKKRVGEWVKINNARYEDGVAWAKEYEQQKVIQWPVHYGQLMAAAFGEPKHSLPRDLRGVTRATVSIQRIPGTGLDSFKLNLLFNNTAAVRIPISSDLYKEILTISTKSESFKQDDAIFHPIPLIGDNNYFLK